MTLHVFNQHSLFGNKTPCLRENCQTVESMGDDLSSQRRSMNVAQFVGPFFKKIGIKSASSVRKTRGAHQGSVNETVSRMTQETPGVLSKYASINQMVNQTLSNREEEGRRLSADMIKKLFNGRSLLEFASDQLKQNPTILNDTLKKILQKESNKKGKDGKCLLNQEALALITQETHTTFPALYLNHQNFTVLSLNWSYLHAGSLYCIYHGIKPHKLSEEEIYFLGFFLAILAHQEETQEAFLYFQVPATLHHLMRHHPGAQEEIPWQQVYAEYFEALRDMQSIEERLLIAANDYSKETYRVRRELVKEILMERGMVPNEGNIDQYIYASNHGVACFLEDHAVTRIFSGDWTEIHHKIYELARERDTIDDEYEKQNASIAKKYAALDREKMQEFFVSFAPEDKAFIEKAEISFCEPTFKDTNLPVFTMVKSPVLALGSSDKSVHLKARVDLHIFSATLNDDVRYYILKMSDLFTYSLLRVDAKRASYEPFLPSDKKDYPHFQFSLYRGAKLKGASESMALFFDQIVEKNQRHYKKVLSDAGYDQTKAEKVIDFVTGFVPFYQFVQAIQRGEYHKAAVALTFDMLGSIPLIGMGGKWVTVSSRSVESALLKGVLQQKTISQFLKITSEELLIQFGKIPVKPLLGEFFKASVLSIGGQVYPFYSAGKLTFKLSADLSRKLFHLVKKAKQMGGPRELNTLSKQLSTSIRRIDLTDIQKMPTEDGIPMTVVKLENGDGAVDYVQMDPNIQVLFGPKYVLEKGNRIVQKVPLEMFHKGEKWLSDEEMAERVKKIDEKIDSGCLSLVRHHRKKRNDLSCSLTEFSGEAVFCTMEALNKERVRLSIELDGVQKKLEGWSKELAALTAESASYQTLQNKYQALEKEYRAKQKRVQAYPIIIETLTESPIYRMRLAKDLFSNYRASLKEVYVRHLDRVNLFEMRDEKGNGILHYLASATCPEAVTFFFNTILKQNRQANQIISVNQEGKNPLGQLIGHVFLERYRKGYEGGIERVYEFFPTGFLADSMNQRILMRQTLFDQVFELFESRIDLESMTHEMIYDIFSQAWKTEGEKRFEQSHWTKVRAWVEGRLLGKINAIDQGTGETLFYKAIKREHLPLIHYLISQQSLDVQGISFGALYDIFALNCKHPAERLIRRGVRQAFVDRVDAFDPNNGDTLLHRAIKDRNANLVAFLKNHGARDSIKNFVEKTPEDLAKEDASLLYPIFDKLIKLGESGSEFEGWVREHFFEAINDAFNPENGDTLLHQACKLSNLNLIVYLKNHRAADQIRNGSQETSEELIVENMSLLYRVLDRGRLVEGNPFGEWVKKFFVSTINNAFDPATGDTLLHQAIRNENIHFVAYLKEHGAVDVANLAGKTPVALVGSFGIVYKIFDKASQVEGLGSPFGQWAEEHFLDKVDLANPETGDTLLHKAMLDEKVDLIAYLKNRGAKDLVEDLHEIAPEDFPRDKHFYDLLYKIFDKASQIPESRFEVWAKKYFLGRINQKVFFEYGETLLHKAVELQNVNLIAYLKNHGAKDGIENGFQKTPEDLVNPSLLYKIFDQAKLAQGSLFEHWVRNQFFVRIDAILNSIGDTLLHQAARNCNISLLVYLKNLGARDRVPNLSGETPETLISSQIHTLYQVFDQARKIRGSGSKFGQWVNEQFLSDINALDPENKDTLLHKAARAHRWQFFNYLKHLGAKGGVLNSLGETPESLEALGKAQGLQGSALFKTHRKREKEGAHVEPTTEDIFEEQSVLQTQRPDNGSLSDCKDRIQSEEEATLDEHKNKKLRVLFLGNALEHISIARKSNDLVLSLGEEKKIAFQGYYPSKKNPLMLRDKQCRRFLFQGHLQENQVARFKSNGTGSLALEIEQNFTSHSINKRSLEPLTQFEKGERMQDPITEHSLGLFDAALLARTLFHKKSIHFGRQKKENVTSRLLRTIEIQKMVCQEGLEGVSQKLNHPFLWSLIEESELSILRREAQDLKEEFEQLLNPSPTVLDALNLVQKQVEALQSKLNILEDFAHVVEEVPADSESGWAFFR